jgi:hypothetical protein
MRDKHPPLYLLTGIILGILAGLLIAYVILPVGYADTTPDTLSSSQRQVYASLIGRAYLYEADSGRAFSRLALLQESNLNSVLVAQAQQLVAAGGDTESARGLALLAAEMNQPNLVITPLVQSTEQPTSITATPDATIATSTPNPTEASPTATQPTATPFFTLTPRPSATPSPTQGAPYQLVSQSGDCAKNDKGTLLIVNVLGSNGNGIPGVKIEISLPNGGSEDFYTGLYPEINNGYADYTMDANTTYTIRVGSGGQPVTGLQVPQCTGSDGKSYTVDLVLTFKQQ